MIEQLTNPVPTTNSRPAPIPAADRLAVNAKRAAELLSLSPASWYRLVSAGKAPKPIRCGGCVRWRVADIREWIEAGCPACSN